MSETHPPTRPHGFPGRGREYWDSRYSDAGFVWTAEPNRFLVAEVAGLRPGRALDLASGEGRNAVWLAEQGWRVTAVDFSEMGLEKAERLAASRGVEVDWILADALEYVPAAAAFDLVAVLYFQVSEPERRLVLRRAADALAPGGTVLVVGHDLTNLTDGYGGPSRPEVLFTPDDVVSDLAGLAIERAERVVRPVATEDGEARAIDALVRARKPKSGGRAYSG